MAILSASPRFLRRLPSSIFSLPRKFLFLFCISPPSYPFHPDPILLSPLILPSSRTHTPRGCLALYVGDLDENKRRFFVEAEIVNHPLFALLLDMAKNEFGFDQQGPLCIPCDFDLFHHVLLLLRSNDPRSLRYAESLLRSAHLHASRRPSP